MIERKIKMNNSYEFDPCTLDDSEEDDITLDNWKPTPKENKIIQSKWRKAKIGENNNQEPGLDELNKIEMYLKRKSPDSEIMKVFGITAETLVAIKRGRYCPVDGIGLDNLSKIQNEFKRLDNALIKTRRGIEYLAKTLFINTEDLKEFKDYCENKKKKAQGRKRKEVITCDEEE